MSDALALCFTCIDGGADLPGADLPDADLNKPLDPQPTHVVKMSCGGLRFNHSVSVDPDTQIDLRMHLPSCGQTIHLPSRVISSGEEANKALSASGQKQYYVQVEFLELDKEAHQLLANHIDYVIAKTGKKQHARHNFG